MIDEVGRTVFERYRWTLVGAYRHAMVNDSEVVVLWAIPTWDAWASWEKTKESDENMVAWRRSTASVVVDWRAKLLAASADSPLGNSAPVN
jgi:ABC-type taurine transport system substrate-binding protein